MAVLQVHPQQWQCGVMQSPRNIRVHRDRRILELVWGPGDVSELPFQAVRQNCHCAVCVDEFTGRRLLDPASVPPEIDLVDASLTGNYALKIRWSDTHDSGLFTWDHLRRIATQLQADSGRATSS